MVNRIRAYWVGVERVLSWVEAPMSVDALRSSVIRRIREEVPEFEGTFQSVLLDEGGELSSALAMDTFAAWLVVRLRADPWAPEIERSFAVVEQIACSSAFHLGGVLTKGFVDAMTGHELAIALLGPTSRTMVKAGSELSWR